MKLHLKDPWPVADFLQQPGSKGRMVLLPAGTYEMELAPHPDLEGAMALVVDGTSLGANVEHWIDESTRVPDVIVFEDDTIEIELVGVIEVAA